MRVKALILAIWFAAFSQTLFAVRLPLISLPPKAAASIKIGILSYAPPFIMRGAHHQWLGYDIALISYICKNLKQPCELKPMPFNEILPAVAKGQLDMAVGGITITPERESLVNFSIPYRVSQTRFLGRAELASVPWALGLLEHKNIGIVRDTVFGNQLAMMSAQHENIQYFSRDSEVIDALYKKQIDLTLLDEDTAFYWQNHSGGALVCLGQPINFGLGFGIAVTPLKPRLLIQINQLLVDYLKSPAYVNDFNTYLAHF